MTTQTMVLPFRRHTLGVALALAIGMANAGTIQVQGDCTLANAITNANNDSDNDGALGCVAGSGNDIIHIKPKRVLTFTQTNNDTDGNNALPSVTSVITINGNHASLNRAATPGTPKFRLFHIGKNGNLTLNKIKLTGGKASLAYVSYVEGNFGGAIFNTGTLSVNDSQLTNNQADTEGGGIFNQSARVTLNNSQITANRAGNGGGVASTYGAVTLTNSTVSANKASNGGGIWNKSGGINLIGSTISGNTASNGAGIHNADYGDNFSPGCIGVTNLLNSTISGNKGVGIQNQDVKLTEYFNNYYGGGYSYYKQPRCTLTVTNSTIADNSSNGVVNRGILTLKNSLLTDNPKDCLNDAEASTQGINFVKDGSCDAQLSGNAKISPLLDNGGSTYTHALLSGSPAINQALKLLCPKSDQRNTNRHLNINQACDIGAYQRLTFLPDSRAGLLQFFDHQASINALVGTTPQKREAVRRQILVAGEYKDRNANLAACQQLKRTLGHIGKNELPDADDYVIGTSANDLEQQIISLRNSWQCK